MIETASKNQRTMMTDTTYDQKSKFLLRYTFQITLHSIWRERNDRRRDGNHGSGPRAWPVKGYHERERESEKKAILVTFPPENIRNSGDDDSTSGDDDSSFGDDDSSSSDDDSSSSVL
ncbi:hypothetical protein HID58_086657 [Brassica napus]|uniref:Uncharacterized protein n=1 Tax=Brassica napus TaxID=3708 RepID=A0ABQ7XRC9_BRANA|nr:hypothetical protein HID58_086657 [Brassica napus]